MELIKDNMMLFNYFQGQIKGEDYPACPPNFKRQSNEQYKLNQEKLIKEQKPNFKKWREDDKLLQNLKIINFEKYYPLGFNLDCNSKETYINKLMINFFHENQYIKLKIVSKISIYNYVIFLGEDEKKDVIPISIFDVDKYYNLNIENWEEVQELYDIGKYILIINPNYQIYGQEMFETEKLDGLICKSPNETILFKDENNLNNFIKLVNKNNFEGFKELGDLMIIRKFYEKSIFYYEKALKEYNINELIKCKIYSLLAEAYINCEYYSKGLKYINKCFNILNSYIIENKENFDSSFIITSLFRKIRCNVGLRKFKEAYDLLKLIKENKNFINFYKLKDDDINKFSSNKNINTLIEIINKGYQNYLGKYNIKEMINEEKNNFFLNNGDYINSKLEISFDTKKGIKIIAKEDIEKGEYILAEKAIYVCKTHDPNNIFETSIKIQSPTHSFCKIEYIDCINNLIKILKKSPLDFKEFFILYNGNNLNKNYEERMKNLPKDLLSILNVEMIEKIFHLNNYVSLRYFCCENKIGIGLWKYFSLFNHSCSPNTTNLGIGDFIFLISNKLIKKGEEITILYLSRPKDYDIKTELFKSIYNFECDCPLCEIEKKSRKQFPELIKQYKFLHTQLFDICNIEKRNRDIKEFSKFLEQNKNSLSEYEIGKGYLEIESCSNEIDEAYKYYKLTEKYLKKYDFELIKINLNNFYDFCNILIQNGEQKVLKYFNEILNTLFEFYKTYGNYSKDELELMLQINLEQKMNDQIILQLESNRLNYY